MSYGPRPWQQTNWDWRAAGNFMLGGTGAGLMIGLALVQNQSPYPVILALLLVAGGLGAVWLEIGRKLRAIHVFFNPQTSWMTRESFAAVLVFGFGLLGFHGGKAMLYAAAALPHSCGARRGSCARPRVFPPGARPRWSRSS